MSERYLKVHVLATVPTSLYDPASYPHPGVFSFPNGFVAVSKSTVLTLCMPIDMPLEFTDSVRNGTGNSNGVGSVGISENTLLKAIAISQNPDLAISLVG